MKKLLFLFLLPVSISAVFMLNSCKLDNPSDMQYTEFVMQIDSILYPDTVRVGNFLPIQFYGPIGPNGCYSFLRFSGSVNNRDINITAYGKKLDGDICTQKPQYLNGVILSVSQLEKGTYIIHVHEPNPPDLIDSVYVRGYAPLK